jgi:hypothetical protein
MDFLEHGFLFLIPFQLKEKKVKLCMRGASRATLHSAASG